MLPERKAGLTTPITQQAVWPSLFSAFSPAAANIYKTAISGLL